MINASPLISVILPVYNGEKYLQRAVQSILDQTFKDFEILIIDDGSTDSSGEIVSSFKDDRIRYIKNSENLKLIKSLNKGLSLAKGQYIARMDGDDIAAPNRLELQLNYMSKNPDVAVLGTNVWIIDKNNRIIDTPRFFPIESDEVFCRALKMSPLFHPTVMMRADILKENGGYNDAFTHAEDYALWMKVIKKYKIANLPERLLYYRIHDLSVSKKYSSEQLESACRVLTDYLGDRSVLCNRDFVLFMQNPYRRISDDKFSEFIKSFVKLQDDMLGGINTKNSFDFKRNDEFWFLLRKTIGNKSVRSWVTFLYFEKSFITNPRAVYYFTSKLLVHLFNKAYLVISRKYV